jgi:hypothetical protein
MDGQASEHVTLWTLHQKNRRLTAEVVSANGGWELRLFAKGVLFIWHPCATRDAAVAFADMIRRDMEGDHWYVHRDLATKP